MENDGIFLFAIIAQVVILVQSCPPSSPPPCSWQTCRPEWRNDWSPSNVPQGRCVQQSRNAHHIYSTHHGSGSCPGPQHCSPQSQRKQLCSCRNAHYCPLSQWSGWSGGVSPGTCGRQSRKRDFQDHIRYLVQSNCNGVKSSCGSSQYDYRTWCACRYASCTLQSWTAWTDLSSPVSHDHCASQERRRRYTLQWMYVERRDNCNGVNPQSCPAELVETREKVITCPRLPAIPHGGWNRDDCTNSPQICKSVCRVTCDIRNGFQVEGPDIRTCSATGQWTTPWNTYCKDVRPPTLTCPNSLVLSNDPGKATARVTLPSPVTSDNSGEAPTVTSNVGTSVKDFGISRTPHSVRYTARDKTGNEAACNFHITVQDRERPKVTKCPSDISVSTEKDQVRVTWDFPTFVDNFDQFPSIVSNRNPGFMFAWGRSLVTYTAYDRARNNATCEFFVVVGPVKCPLFDPPQFGVRACNRNTQASNGVTYEMLCNIQCKDGYAFAEETSNVYLCPSDGTWHHMLHGFPQKVNSPTRRPWPDCAPKTNVVSTAKEFTFYTGTCTGNAEAEKKALDQIRKNFLTAIMTSPITNMMLCQTSAGMDCVVENVNVYCGSRSKRNGAIQERTIKFEFVMKDMKQSGDKTQEAAKLEKMKKDMLEVEDWIRKNFPSSANMPSLQITAKSTTPFCPANKVLRMPKNAPADFANGLCVDCPIGEFFDNTTRKCSKCPVGQYQDEVGQNSCKSCPKGRLSVEPGARNVTQCYDTCEPGEHSHMGAGGAVTCMACPIGSYQPQALSKSCLKCPDGKTTQRVGAATLSDCK